MVRELELTFCLRHRYECEKSVGRGAYGSVFRARDRISGSMVAIKRPEIHKAYALESLQMSMVREAGLIKLLSKKNHENILNLRDVEFNESRVLLVFDLYDCNLRDHMTEVACSGQAQMNPHQVHSFMTHLFSALEHCHSYGVLHRDVKPDNLLLDAQRSRLVLCDFGLSRQVAPLQKDLTGQVATVWYRSPELLLGETCYSGEVDIWSAGMVLAEMLLLRPPLANAVTEAACLCSLFQTLGFPESASWPDMSRLPYFAHINSLPRLPQRRPSAVWVPQLSKTWPAASILLDALLKFCPSSRPSASQALAILLPPTEVGSAGHGSTTAKTLDDSADGQPILDKLETSTDSFASPSSIDSCYRHPAHAVHGSSPIRDWLSAISSDSASETLSSRSTEPASPASEQGDAPATGTLADPIVSLGKRRQGGEPAHETNGGSGAAGCSTGTTAWSPCLEPSGRSERKRRAGEACAAQVLNYILDASGVQVLGEQQVQQQSYQTPWDKSNKSKQVGCLCEEGSGMQCEEQMEQWWSEAPCS
jgi:serine/threonine protein kinase